MFPTSEQSKLNTCLTLAINHSFVASLIQVYGHLRKSHDHLSNEWLAPGYKPVLLGRRLKALAFSLGYENTAYTAFPNLYFKFACLSNIISALFPFKYPINDDTLILGGMLTNI